MSQAAAQPWVRWIAGAAPRPGSRRRLIVVVLGAVVVAAVLGTFFVAWPSRRPGAATATVDEQRAAAVRPLLRARAQAVAGADRTGWDATLDDVPPDAASRAYRDRQLAVLDRIRQLAPTGWREDLVSTAPLDPGRASAGDPFVAHVRLSFRLAGDTRDTTREEYLTVVRRPGGPRLAGDTAGPTQRAPWDLGPLTVVRTARTLAIGIGEGQAVAEEVGRTAREADAAAARVDASWPGAWRRPAVVVVPRDAAGFAAALDLPPAAAPQGLAALTTGELAVPAGGTPAARSSADGTADRVVVDPDVFPRLTEVGRRVVLTHELTHVATRAVARTAPPLWVEEGFADWVAYRGSGLARSAIAAEVLPAARAGTAPASLPDDDAFDASRGPTGAAYADAWLAFDLMAAEGAGRPVAFYRAAAGLDGTCAAGDRAGCLAGAFTRVLGTDRAAFEVRWRAWRAEAVT